MDGSNGRRGRFWMAYGRWPAKGLSPASGSNWAGFGADVGLPAGFGAEVVLTDPQTSGGRLVSCRPSVLARVLTTFRRHGLEQAAVVGSQAATGVAPRLQLS